MKFKAAPLFLGLLSFVMAPALRADVPTDPTPEKCEQVWNKMIEFSVPGDFVTYKITSTIQAPQFSRQTITISKTTVEEVSEDVIVNLIETTIDGQVHPGSKHSLTKVQFIKTCSSFSGQRPEVLEEGIRQAIVPAGTFECAYKKMKIGGAVGGTTLSETYISRLASGREMMVKSVTNTQMAQGMTSFSVQELMDYRH